MNPTAAAAAFLRGICVPLITPFTAGGDEVARDALEELARGVLADGAAGLVALGTTAEAATLDEDEQRAVVDTVSRVCRERGAPLIVGAGDNDTRRSTEALGALGRRGDVTAALVPVPYFTRPSEAGVVAHFARLCETTPVPVLVYNIPYRTGRTLTADTLRRLAALPRVIGVKQAVGAVDAETVDLLGYPPPGFTFLAGDDAYLSPLLALGAQGGILASAQLRTACFVEPAAAWAAGDVPRARALGHPLAALARALFAEPSPTVLKGVLHDLGRIPSAAVRLPLLPAAAGSVAKAREKMSDLPG